MKKRRILTTIASILLGIGIVGYIGALIVDNKDASNVLYVISTIAEIGGLLITIITFTFLGFSPVEEDKVPVKKEVKTVDVKPIKESEEEKLYKKYEDLYKEGLISKEDLEKKKKELLGK